MCVKGGNINSHELILQCAFHGLPNKQNMHPGVSPPPVSNTFLYISIFKFLYFT